MEKLTILLCSVFGEAEQLRDDMKNPVIEVIGRKEVLLGELAGCNVLLAASGVGKTNAAHMLTAIAEHVSPERVFLFGCAGAYLNTGLAVGDVAIATKEVYGDEGILTHKGFCDLQYMNLPTVCTPNNTRYNEFQLDRTLSERAESVLRREGYALVKGTFVTVSCCSGTQKGGELLQHRFDGICENMEGAAVAHVCALYGIPLLEIRGISNLVVDRSVQEWDFPLAVSQCQRAILSVVGQL
jgi:futalosine hydrolase